MSDRQSVEKALSTLALPKDALEWLVDFYEVIQGLDDWKDNDPVDDNQKQAVIYMALVNLPANRFFRLYADRLLPIVSNLVLKWCAANHFEEHKETEQLPKCYMWRAGFYDLVLETVACVYGYRTAIEAAPIALSLYGESLDKYLKEFNNA